MFLGVLYFHSAAPSLEEEGSDIAPLPELFFPPGDPGECEYSNIVASLSFAHILRCRMTTHCVITCNDTSQHAMLIAFHMNKSSNYAVPDPSSSSEGVRLKACPH